MTRCAGCLFWKRRVGAFGSCYHDSQPITPTRTHEDFCCQWHVPKVTRCR